LSDSYFSSIRINEGLLIAWLDGDPEAKEIVESWAPNYQVITVGADDLILQRVVTFG
jgi:hypothetical protein